ncbi:MAG: hypothetical protein AB7O65_00695 [Candidatus Korobacteraceae bacterium]
MPPISVVYSSLYGAEETACKPTGSNAISNATGVRLRRIPFRKERVLAALKTARV